MIWIQWSWPFQTGWRGCRARRRANWRLFFINIFQDCKQVFGHEMLSWPRETVWFIIAHSPSHSASWHQFMLLGEQVHMSVSELLLSVRKSVISGIEPATLQSHLWANSLTTQLLARHYFAEKWERVAFRHDWTIHNPVLSGVGMVNS